MREIISTGKTVEEATENACRELALSRDEVSVEILDMPVKRLFKSLPAKVKVRALEEDKTEKKVEPAKTAEAMSPKTQPLTQAKTAFVKKERETASAPLLPEEPEEAIDLAQNPRAKLAADYLLEIFVAMGVEKTVKITAHKQGDATLLRVFGDSVGEKMEIRGESIQALSYLIDRAVNTGVDKREDDYIRIRLDISGYRNRREVELLALAQRTAQEVAETGKSRTLAPMNPYERLIVHTAIGKIDGVASESIGTDVERRVVVRSLGANASDGANAQREGQNRKTSGGKGRQNSRNNDRNRPRTAQRGKESSRTSAYQGGPKPTNTPEREYAEKPRDFSQGPTVPNRREAIKDGEDLPLYGKIDL